jgi:hypothetical protein
MQNIPGAADLKEIIPEVGEVLFIDSGGFKAVYKAEINGRIEALKVVFVPKEEDQMEPLTFI